MSPNATRIYELPWNRLQKRSNDGSEAEDAASGNLDVGSSARGVLGSTSAGSRSGWTGGARGTSRARGTRGTGTSRSSGCRGVDDNGGAVVGANDNSAGLVEHGASAGKDKSGDASADSWDVGRERLRGDDCGLVGLLGNSGGLSGLRGGDGELAGHNTKGVGRPQKVGLGEGIDRGLVQC